MRRGFTLAEVLIAVGLLAVVILAIAALTISAVRSNQKAAMLGPASQVTDTLVNQTIYQVDSDVPAGTRASFWGHNGAAPWMSDSLTAGGVDYDYIIYLNDVPGFPNPGNRVKKMDLVLWWWDSRSQSGDRQGYGRLQMRATRLVNEVAP